MIHLDTHHDCKFTWIVASNLYDVEKYIFLSKQYDKQHNQRVIHPTKPANKLAPRTISTSIMRKKEDNCLPIIIAIPSRVTAFLKYRTLAAFPFYKLLYIDLPIYSFFIAVLYYSLKQKLYITN